MSHPLGRTLLLGTDHEDPERLAFLGMLSVLGGSAVMLLVLALGWGEAGFVGLFRGETFSMKSYAGLARLFFTSTLFCAALVLVLADILHRCRKGEWLTFNRACLICGLWHVTVVPLLWIRPVSHTIIYVVSCAFLGLIPLVFASFLVMGLLLLALRGLGFIGGRLVGAVKDADMLKHLVLQSSRKQVIKAAARRLDNGALAELALAASAERVDHILDSLDDVALRKDVTAQRAERESRDLLAKARGRNLDLLRGISTTGYVWFAGLDTTASETQLVRLVAECSAVRGWLKDYVVRVVTFEGSLRRHVESRWAHLDCSSEEKDALVENEIESFKHPSVIAHFARPSLAKGGAPLAELPQVIRHTLSDRATLLAALFLETK